ncbi:hypothetical protein HYH02_012659 [Chlamydomonas schloesseri]|uniref:Enhancer of polycomb-like protein n=1 Tax=Chlamydomonas schloesseri TaxID=2026947 RepID=A0A835VY29_9CHLO|nr:hypothetical protein HYH02_012659 [Chlamydomonas schloesseri]|eukprot:KAG2433542.1 hypothetical protein HYH02_012659 [Chlamydomonas schloesseri]
MGDRSLRTSFRPRPVDIGRQLNIVRDVAELDNSEEVNQAQGAAPSEQAPPTTHQKKKKEVKEIPVPEVGFIPGYTREYLPVFRIPETYIRSKSGVGLAKEDYVEYDLDNEDEDWLEAYNAGAANRLSEEKFEQMLWRLETSNADANQRVMNEPGYAPDYRVLPAAVAATHNMSREEALSVLRKYATAREPILVAVYEYWKNKRERWGKPFMRRLQAPTNPSDTNPYNVFRPRERVNRPQTRRRRENTQDCLDKLRQIRESMLKSLELTELVLFRETRKRDMLRLDLDMQRYQIARHHLSPTQHAAIEAEAAAQLTATTGRTRHGEARLRAYLDNSASLSASTTSYDTPLRRALGRKRRRQENEGLINGEGIARLPPPPLPADDEMLILFTPDPVKLAGLAPPPPPPGPGTFGIAAFAPDVPPPKPPMVALAPALDPRCVRARVGRCGRTMFTRCDPFTLEPHPPMDPAAGAAANGAGGGGGPAHVFSPARHPLLHSSQQPGLPWAAVLDLELLPEGVVDKAALKALRERRLNADRNNAMALRQTCAALTQQAAGGMLGTSGVTGAAAAAAAPPMQLPVLASPPPAAPPAPAAAAASPPVPATGPAGALPHRPPPPSGAVQGAPAGTLPHMPAPGAPAGTLPHVPPGGTGAAPPATVVAATPGAPSLPGAGPSGSLAATPVPGSAPGSGGAGPARKVPKAPGAPGSVAGTPAPGAVVGATPAAANAVAASRSPSPGGPGIAPKQVAPGGTAPAVPAAAHATPAAVPGMPGAAPAVTPLPTVAGVAVPGAEATGGEAAGGAVKTLLTQQAAAGPSSASQLKRGPARVTKTGSKAANGEATPAPPINTTVPMDTL